VCLVVATALGLATTPAVAQMFTLTTPDCASARGNSVINVSITPETGWSSVRTYFRKAGTLEFYYVEMRSAGGGKYWAALPRPEDSTTSVELQTAVRDAEGRETRTPFQKVPVTTSCSLSLTPEQDGYAQNLVVGETVPSQAGQGIAGFVCEGVISRIDARGNLKPDDSCRGILMAEGAAAAEDRRKVLPLILLGAGGVALVNHKDPPRPRSHARNRRCGISGGTSSSPFPLPFGERTGTYQRASVAHPGSALRTWCHREDSERSEADDAISSFWTGLPRRDLPCRPGRPRTSRRFSCRCPFSVLAFA